MESKEKFYQKWWFWVSIIAVVIIIIVIITMTIKQKEKDAETATKNISEESLKAEEIVNILKGKVPFIGNIVVYTEETDLNNLLGRPNQYIYKATFEDIRLEQTNKSLDSDYFSEEEINEPIGGTVEVFINTKDLNNRKKYIETLSSNMSIFNQYIYSSANVLLRLDNKLTPSQAQEYEKAFYETIK